MHSLADVRSIVFMATWFASTAAQINGRSVHNELWYVTILLHVFNSMHAFQGCVMTHNAMHIAVFKTVQLNRIYRVLLSIWQGGPVSTYESGHNKTHHTFLESERDPMRCSSVRYRWDCWNILLFFGTTMPRVVRNDNQYIYTAFVLKNWGFLVQFVIEFACHLGFVGACLYSYGWFKTVVVYIFPALCGKAMIITLNFLQHDGCDIDHPYNHSRNFTGKALNFLCCNNGYHAVHHNHPRMHWSLLEKKHQSIQHLVDPNLCRVSILYYILERMCSKSRRWQ